MAIVGKIALGLATFAFATFASSSFASSPDLNFDSLEQCMAAHKRERALGMEANAKASRAALFSKEEKAAFEQQNAHFAKARLIDSICEKMKSNSGALSPVKRPADRAGQEPPGIAESLQKAHEIINELDPLRGTSSTSTKAIQEHNIGIIQHAHVALGARADKAIAEIEGADFGRNSPATKPLKPVRPANFSDVQAIANMAVAEALANTETEMKVARQQIYSGADLVSEAQSARSDVGVISNQSLIASTRSPLIIGQPRLDAGAYRGPSTLAAAQCQQLIDQNKEIERTVESLRQAPGSESILKDAKAAHDSNAQMYIEKCR